MKLVYCIAGTRHSGGMERVLTNKANYWVNHGHEVLIVTTDQCGEAPYFTLDSRVRCVDLAINYEENNGKGIWNKLIKYPFKQYLHRKRLAEILRAENPDCTISMFCNDASFLYRIKEGGRKFLEVHFSRNKRMQYGRSGIWKWADKFRSHLDKKCIRHYEKFVVLTEEDSALWGISDNIVVIPNASGIHVDEAASLDAKNVLAIGRLTYQKGFDRLIAAWSMVHDKHPEWRLTIVGDGEEKKNLLHQIKLLGMEDCVVIKSATKDVQSLYMNAAFVAMSSRYEGLPMILIEAQCFDLPIVSFDCQCGPKDIITDGIDGFLVPEGDVGQLAEKMDCLMCDEQLRKRMGCAAKEASHRYDEQVVMEKWKHVLGVQE